ncbi:hypothetical protein [Leucobacter komagatae]|uniref:Alpha-tubulin suppressor-like RCC1 family protein n=1 Tax=Leucobacter komagatae TaxID=55969 RepID=A0A0D0HV32_9MICO|nr:hypothetical protein [Leucobacter komagatae]KIP51441.1 hypothetical protein SD72_15295 [Leucobacter komagatae]
MTKSQTRSGRWARRSVVAMGAIAAVVGVAVALPTAAAYKDTSHARTDAVPAHVTPPFQPGLSKNTRMVDTGIGLGNDGNVYVWGRTDMGINGGAPGAGTRNGPQRVPLPENETVGITGGIYNANSLSTDGTVWGWGTYAKRDGTDGAKPGGNPKQVRIGTPWNGNGELLDRILAISSTEYAGAGIRDDGTVWHWGSPVGYGGTSGNGAAQLRGLPDPAVAGNRPVYLKGAYTNFFVILENGDVYFWGGAGGSSLPKNTNGTGSSATYLGALAPWMQQNVAEGEPYIVAVDGGINMGGAILSDGQVVSWSRSTASRTGRGAPISPAIIPTLSGIESMQFGFTGVAMLNGNNELWGYGASDDYGKFPQRPALIDTDVRQYGSGQGYYIWQRGDRTFWGRGYNPQGALGMPTGTTSTNRQISWDLEVIAQ